MSQRKQEAYKYAANCLFRAAEYLREALDTIDIEGLDAYLSEGMEAIETKLLRRAQLAQKHQETEQ